MKAKIKAILHKVHKKLLYRQDEPGSKLDREWRWKPVIESYELGSFCIGMNLLMIKFEGKQYKNWLIGCFGLIFYYNPRKWEIKSLHTYYDGPNCIEQFGPIAWHRSSIGHCKKCYNEK